MPGVKQALKRKRVTKAVPALGAVGLTFSLVGGASASAVPTTDTAQTPNMAPGHEITLGEEEISDVSLATFYVFDNEIAGTLRGLVQEARGCGGCRGCGGGCRGCGGCRGGVGVGCRGGIGVGCRGGIGFGCGGGCLSGELAAELAGELEAAARRGELAAGARADRLPIALTNAGAYGRVRQKRPGQSMSCLQRCPRVAKPLAQQLNESPAVSRNASAREFQWSENMPCKSEPESWARCAC